MIFSSTNLSIALILSFFLLRVSPSCNCNSSECLKNPETETNGIFFKLKDSLTGNDILTFNGSTQSVPDSIKLRDIRTGYSYPLFIGLGVNESEVYSLQYKRPANIIDTLEFKFGNKFDTLFVHTGIVDGWRGDECGSVKEPGIIKVVLRNQVLIETTYDIAIFTLKE